MHLIKPGAYSGHDVGRAYHNPGSGYEQELE
jgi:hypothetical protein